MKLCNWQAFYIVKANERNMAVNLQGIRAAAEAVAGGVLDPSPLYTHTMGLDRLAGALNGLRDRPDGFLKALVTM